MNVQETILDPASIHLMIVVEKLPSDGQKWEQFKNYVSSGNGWQSANIAKRGIENGRISENIWLFPLSTGLPNLGRLAAGAEFAGFPYKYLVFPAEPPWVLAGDRSKLEDKTCA
jgi:hypothetical protein